MVLNKPKRKPLVVDFDDPTPLPKSKVNLSNIRATPTTPPERPSQRAREVSDAHKEKLMAGRQDSLSEKKDRQANPLRIGNYRIYRSDENNINLESKRKTEEGKIVWDIEGYYPTLQNAVFALYDRKISEKEILIANDILKAIKDCKDEILKEIADYEF